MSAANYEGAGHDAVEEMPLDAILNQLLPRLVLPPSFSSCLTAFRVMAKSQILRDAALRWRSSMCWSAALRPSRAISPGVTTALRPAVE